MESGCFVRRLWVIVGILDNSPRFQHTDKEKRLTNGEKSVYLYLQPCLPYNNP